MEQAEGQPWERQPGEPSLWYDRFHAFLLSGRRRAVLAVYNQEREKAGEGPKRSAPKSWRDAASRWQWHARAAAFDAHMREEQEREWRDRIMPEGQILALLSDQARVDVSDFFDIDEEGQPVLNLAKAQEAGKLHLIRGFKYDRQGRLIVEFHNAQKALELMGKYYKLFRDAIEHSGNTGVAFDYLGDLSDDELSRQIAELEAEEAAGLLPAAS